MMNNQVGNPKPVIINEQSTRAYIGRGANLVAIVMVLMSILPFDISHAVGQDDGPDEPPAPLKMVTPEDSKNRSAVQASLRPLRILGDARFKHANTITHIDTLDADRKIATSSNDSTVRFWDAITGQELDRFVHPPGTVVRHFEIARQSKELITLTRPDFIIRRWNLPTGKLTSETPLGKLAPIKSFYLCNDEKQLLLVSDKPPLLWDLKRAAKVGEFEWRGSWYAPGFKFNISADRKTLVGLADYSNPIHRWDVASGKLKPLENAKAIGNWTGTVVVSPKGKYFATTGRRKYGLKVWDAEAGKLVWHLKAGNDNDTPKISFSPDGKQLLAVVANDHTPFEGDDTYPHADVFYRVDVRSGRVINKTKLNSRNGNWHTFSHNKKYELGLSDDDPGLANNQSLEIIDLQTGTERFDEKSRLRPAGGIELMGTLPGTGNILLAGNDRRFHVWSLHSGVSQLHDIDTKWIGGICIPPNGKHFIFWGGRDDAREALRIFDSVDLSEDTVIPAPGLRIHGIAANKQFVVASGFSKKFKTGGFFVWNLESKNKITEFAAFQEGFSKFCISPHESHLATLSGDDENRLQIWDFVKGEQLHQLPEAKAKLTCFAFAGKGNTILAGDESGNLYAWGPRPSDKPVLAPRKLSELVRQLDAEEFQDREDAQAALVGEGDSALPHLDNVKVPSLELQSRIAQTRFEIALAKLPGHPLGKPLSLGSSVTNLAIHPDGQHFAAVIGHPGTSSVILGKLEKGNLVLCDEVDDRQSPCLIQFNPDGKELYTGNNNGTVSVFRVALAP